MFPFTRRRKTKTNILATECAFYSAESIPRRLNLWFTHVSWSVFTRGHRGEAWRGLWPWLRPGRDLGSYSSEGAQEGQREGDSGSQSVGLRLGSMWRRERRNGYLHCCFAHAALRPGIPFYFSVWPTPTHSSKPSSSLPRMLQADLALPSWNSLSPVPIHLGTDHLVSLDRELLESGTMTIHV